MALIRANSGGGGGNVNCVVGTIPSSEVVAGGTVKIPINFTPKVILFIKDIYAVPSVQRGLYWLYNGTTYFVQIYGGGSSQQLYNITIGTPGNSVPALMSKSATEVVLQFPNNSADAQGEWYYMISDAVGNGYTIS